jgi:hypothetical protein
VTSTTGALVTVAERDPFEPLDVDDARGDRRVANRPISCAGGAPIGAATDRLRSAIASARAA